MIKLIDKLAENSFEKMTNPRKAINYYKSLYTGIMAFGSIIGNQDILNLGMSLYQAYQNTYEPVPKMR